MAAITHTGNDADKDMRTCAKTETDTDIGALQCHGPPRCPECTRKWPNSPRASVGAADCAAARNPNTTARTPSCAFAPRGPSATASPPSRTDGTCRARACVGVDGVWLSAIQASGERPPCDSSSGVWTATIFGVCDQAPIFGVCDQAPIFGVCDQAPIIADLTQQ